MKVTHGEKTLLHHFHQTEGTVSGCQRTDKGERDPQTLMSANGKKCQKYCRVYVVVSGWQTIIQR